MTLPGSRRSAWVPRACGALALLLLVVVLQAYHGISLISPSVYNSYTRQALAWRQGRADLPADVPHLELAIFEGRWYVSFPPVPSLPIYPLTFLFGGAVPDGILMLLYALTAFFALARLLGRAGWRPWPSAVIAFFFSASSSMLPLLLTGAVWYQAQVLAFALTCLSIERLHADKPTQGLLCYALAVGCRPFNALYGPLLMLIYLFRARQDGLWPRLRRLLPGAAIGLCVAAAYAWYNLVRFGDPFEFGHNHLPEFSFQGGKQFSLSHIARNLPTFLLGLPFQGGKAALSLRRFGFSLFLANPMLLLLAFWALSDLLRRKTSPLKGLVMLCWLVHLLLLLSHRTFGGFQYGARYAVDLVPYAAVYLSLDARQRAWRWPQIAVLSLGLMLAVLGSMQILLPS